MERLHPGVPTERGLAGEHFVEERPHRKEVAAAIDLFPPDLLRGHIGGGAHDPTGVRVAAHRCVRAAVGGRAPVHGLGEAEVDHLDVPGGGQHHVLRLEVAVDDALGVGLGEALHDLDRQLERPVGGERSPGEGGGEGLAAHQLHRDEGRPFGLVDLVDDGEGGMGERSRGAGLLPEPAREVRIRHRVGEDLEGHLAPEACVPGAVDDAHAPPAQLLEDLVVAQPSADHPSTLTGF